MPRADPAASEVGVIALMVLAGLVVAASMIH
jgi:hypothetical protein